MNSTVPLIFTRALGDVVGKRILIHRKSLKFAVYIFHYFNNEYACMEIVCISVSWQAKRKQITKTFHVIDDEIPSLLMQAISSVATSFLYSIYTQHIFYIYFFPLRVFHTLLKDTYYRIPHAGKDSYRIFPFQVTFTVDEGSSNFHCG